MVLEDAVALFGARPLAGGREPQRWADLGCGDGTFTLALATLLPPGSTIHAMDRDQAALNRIPTAHGRSSIVKHVGDFSHTPWPFDGLDGVLMANSLHYVRDQRALIAACMAAMKQRRFLIVEYDMDGGNRWVPYPVSRGTLKTLFDDVEGTSIRILGTRPSIYQRAPLYAALVASTL